MLYKDRPQILVVDDEPLNREFASRILVAAGWQVETASGGEEAIEALAAGLRPTLILMDLHLEGMGGGETTAAIRASGGAAAAAPILAYTTTCLRDPEQLRARGFDGFLAKPATPEELIAAAAAWRPDGAGDALDRLEESFGPEEIRGLTRRFGLLLEEALTDIDGAAAPVLAHRVAGIAGTLGFAGVGKAWLAVSQGDATARESALREARRALAVIAAR